MYEEHSESKWNLTLYFLRNGEWTTEINSKLEVLICEYFVKTKAWQLL